jgi:hypothetical protein
MKARATLYRLMSRCSQSSGLPIGRIATPDGKTYRSLALGQDHRHDLGADVGRRSSKAKRWSEKIFKSERRAK